ncbi:branched chain amino acid/phenylalanine ABC transporter ATP binding subunit LivF [uncultured Gammaproteobacteria bacterium]
MHIAKCFGIPLSRFVAPIAEPAQRHRLLSIHVERGAVVTLIGANGAGKTTTLRGISGLLAPSGGSLFYDGVDIAHWPAHRIARAGIVQVPEGRQLFGGMTIAENLRMGAFEVTDRFEIERRRAAVLERFPKLAERLNERAGVLSGGEQQMVALGRALMAEPKLLLLDEPSMGLAPLVVERIFAIIADLKREGRTILLIEQNAQAALEVADYAYVLEGGVITLRGAAAALIDNPAVIEAYLGSR